MKRAELLGVLLKTIGAWSVVGGIGGLPQAFQFSYGYRDERAFMLMMANTFAAPIVTIGVGLCFIRATNWFVRIADSARDPTAENASEEGSRETYGALLKALGYWEMLYGAVKAPYEFARAYEASGMTFDGIACTGITIVAGCFLVFATDWCVEFAYRRPSPS